MATHGDDEFFKPVVTYRMPKFELQGSAWPQNTDVLRVLLFKVNDLKQTLLESVRATATELQAICISRGYPALSINASVARVRALYNTYDALRKSWRRGGAAFDAKMERFRSELQAVMDVRKPTGASDHPDRKQKRKAVHALESHLSKARKFGGTKREPNKCEEIPSDFDDFESDTDGDEADPTFTPGQANGTFEENLDRAAVSARDASRIAASFPGADPATAGGLSPTALYRRRAKHRKEKADAIRADFQPEGPLTVHWDGIKVALLVGKEKDLVERLPVCVTGEGVKQFLGAGVIPNGTGQAQANEVVRQLNGWTIIRKVCARCSDTTRSNTGRNIGAAVLIEKALGKRLLYLACRHHVLELVPKVLFEKLIESSSNPDLGALCKKFAESWDSIDHNDYQPVTADPDLPDILSEARAKQIVSFAKATLKKPQICEDYQYLLELTVVFLGEVPDNGVHFRPPIAQTSARFMARIIYLLSIYLFGATGQFAIEPDVLASIRRVCVFIMVTYIEPWFTATDPIAAPRQDLKFLKNILSYPDKQVSDIAAKTFSNHFWYFGEENVALALFDPLVTLETKRKMVTALSKPAVKHAQPRYILAAKEEPQHLSNVSLDFFVTSRTKDFFKILDLDSSFLQKDPVLWENDALYQKAMKCAAALHVVNDIAERGVALVKHYNRKVTRNEDSFQNLLVVTQTLRSDKKLNLEYFY